MLLSSNHEEVPCSCGNYFIIDKLNIMIEKVKVHCRIEKRYLTRNGIGFQVFINDWDGFVPR